MVVEAQGIYYWKPKSEVSSHVLSPAQQTDKKI